MTTINGTISANANPGPAFYAAIEPTLLALGFTLVDTVVIGGNTHKVLKSAGASGGNTYGLDWYLDINYPTTGITGGIRFAPFEGYNASTHVATNGPYASSSLTIDPTTYSRFGTTPSALETNWVNSASYTAISGSLVTAAFNYRVSITRDRIIALLTNNPGQLHYAGFFTPSAAHSSTAGAALYPLVMAVLTAGSGYSFTSTSASQTNCAFTRLPKLSAMTSSGWAGSGIIATQVGGVGGAPEGQIGTAASPFTGRSTLKPLPVMMSASGVSVSSVGNNTPLVDDVGTLDDVSCGYVSSSSVRDDSVTVGSDTWYDCSPNSNSTLFMRGV